MFTIKCPACGRRLDLTQAAECSCGAIVRVMGWKEIETMLKAVLERPRPLPARVDHGELVITVCTRTGRLAVELFAVSDSMKRRLGVAHVDGWASYFLDPPPYTDPKLIIITRVHTCNCDRKPAA